MSDLSVPVLLAIFATAAIVTWIAGVRLAAATDVIDDHFGLGEAIGGMILLSVVGSLPELAITVTAVLADDLGLAAGNLIGGVAMQTLVLVIADRFMRGSRPLSAAAGSLVPALEGLLVVAVVAVTVKSALLPETAAIGPVGVGAIAIVVVWFLGIFILNKVRGRPDLALTTPGPATVGAAPAPATPPSPTADGSAPKAGRAMVVFGVGAGITLIAGVFLEQSGNALANEWGMNGVLFGATILAAATALPEISTGITGVRMGRYTLVFGDMFGGNAFQLTLFLVADVLAGKPVLPFEGASNAWIGMTGILMTTIFVTGIILRPSRRHAGLGLDSLLVLLVYVIGLWGLVVVSS